MTYISLINIKKLKNRWPLIAVCHHIIGVSNEHMPDGQWTFHGVPCVIILMAETLMIETNPMSF